MARIARETAEAPEMWGTHKPSKEEVDQLAQCFELEWVRAVDTMLKGWTTDPTWY